MTMLTPKDALGVAAFWRAAGYDRWFLKSDVFDALVRLRFGRLHEDARGGALDNWSETPAGSLGLLILLDQAPRNLFRDSAKAFAADPVAVKVAETAVARGFHRRVMKVMRRFFALPFEHAEDAGLQARSLALFREIGDPDGIRYAEVHAEIIARFGRFPHRNVALGRSSTKEERRFLAEGGFAG